MLLSSKINSLSSILGEDLNIVEGIKDRTALNKFGVNNVFEISGKPLSEIADILHAKDIKAVTILTDFDEDGEHKKSQLTNYLSHVGIKINSFARKRIQTLFRIHKIEELAQFTKFMEDDYTGKVSSIYDKVFNRSRIYSRWRGGKTRRHRGDIWTD
jgi:5S rRNA maturation endonuclease (ribonuclease M5)